MYICREGTCICICIYRRRGEEEDACHRPSPDKEKYFFIFMMWLHGKIKTNSANLYLCVNVCRYVCIYLINVNVNKCNFHIPLRKWTLMNAATMTKKHWPNKKRKESLCLPVHRQPSPQLPPPPPPSLLFPARFIKNYTHKKVFYLC